MLKEIRESIKRLTKAITVQTKEMRARRENDKKIMEELKGIGKELERWRRGREIKIDI